MILTEREEIMKGRETILLVDDEKCNIIFMKEILESLGYRVMLAGCGQEAIAIYLERGREIDLVILDLIMPGMGGGEAFDTLRGINPDLKVILSSGYGMDGEAQWIMERGCNGFIQKPFRIAELVKKLRDILGGSSDPRSNKAFVDKPLSGSGPDLAAPSGAGTYLPTYALTDPDHA